MTGTPTTPPEKHAPCFDAFLRRQLKQSFDQAYKQFDPQWRPFAMSMPHSREPRWKFWMARIFGKKTIACDHISGNEAYIIEGRTWRGQLYILKYHHVVDNHKQEVR
jgi:hypothetical protein